MGFKRPQVQLLSLGPRKSLENAEFSGFFRFVGSSGKIKKELEKRFPGCAITNLLRMPIPSNCVGDAAQIVERDVLIMAQHFGGGAAGSS